VTHRDDAFTNTDTAALEGQSPLTRDCGVRPLLPWADSVGLSWTSWKQWVWVCSWGVTQRRSYVLLRMRCAERDC